MNIHQHASSPSPRAISLNVVRQCRLLECRRRRQPISLSSWTHASKLGGGFVDCGSFLTMISHDESGTISRHQPPTFLRVRECDCTQGVLTGGGPVARLGVHCKPVRFLPATFYSADRQGCRRNVIRKQALNLPRMLKRQSGSSRRHRSRSLAAAGASPLWEGGGGGNRRIPRGGRPKQDFDVSDGYTGNGYRAGRNANRRVHMRADHYRRARAPKRIDTNHRQGSALSSTKAHALRQKNRFYLQVSHYAVHLGHFLQTTKNAGGCL